MDFIKEQEKEVGTQELIKALQQLAPPDKSDSEWLLMRNQVFAEIDCLEAGKAQPLERNVIGSLFDLIIPVLRHPALMASVPLLLLVVAGLFYLPSLTGQFQSAIEITVAQKTGRIESLAPDSRGGAWSEVGSEISGKVGETFRTAEKGGLVIRIGEKTGIKLLENSELKIVRASSKGQVFELVRGSVLASVANNNVRRFFCVRTASSNCLVVGTQFRVDLLSNGDITRLSVAEGKVLFEDRHHPDRRTLVSQGSYAVFDGKFHGEKQSEDQLTALREVLASLQMTLSVDAISETHGGMASITSNPIGANVSLDGKIIGITPLVLRRPAGEYTATVRSRGFKEWQGKVTVVENEEIKIAVELRPALRAPTWPKHDARHEGRAQVLSGPAYSVQAPMAAKTLLGSDGFKRILKEIDGGNYKTAIDLLNIQKSKRGMGLDDNVIIAEKLAMCYKGNEDYRSAVRILEDLYNFVRDEVKKDNVLWEICRIKAYRLGDYKAARDDLIDYIEKFPNGIWIHEAYLKLGELHYLLREPRKSVNVYEEFVAQFSDAPIVDKAIYNIAYIEGHDLKDCIQAIRWYNRLEREHTTSSYLQDCIFWKADCLYAVGRVSDAEKEYKKYLTMYPSGRWKDAASERLSSLFKVE